LTALIDTSAVLAAVDRKDPAHARVVAALSVERSSIALPIVALPEIGFLLDARHGAARAAVAMDRLVRGGWPVVAMDAADLQRATELMARYADARIGFVDAAIAAIAERLGAVRIYTLDRRDFAILRPRHAEAFEVLPGP
jgi:predicted nucleic acid-binding protein